MATQVFSYQIIHKLLPLLVDAIPAEWRGTTFKNTQLLGREGFAAKLQALCLQKANEGTTTITEKELELVGNAEDYLRVATNISTLLELVLSLERGLNDVTRVFTFASSKLPILSVLLTSSKTLRLYIGQDPSPFTPSQIETYLSVLGPKLIIEQGPAPSTRPNNSDEELLLATHSASTDLILADNSVIDGFVSKQVLYIVNPKRIPPDSILVARKRTATPMTTPQALAFLREKAHLPPCPSHTPQNRDKKLVELYEHLQTMSGASANAEAPPLLFTAGLAALCCLWVSLIADGGADVVMCSTAYGGSSQLTDVLCGRTPNFRKHTYDVQQDTKIGESVQATLNKLSSSDSLLPTTVLFVEMPTNPDMKILNLEEVVKLSKSYREATTSKGVRRFLLLVDTTFVPGSKVLQQIRNLDEELVALTFISLSKSVSRGYTTAGSLVANDTKEAQHVLKLVAAATEVFGTAATEDQVDVLIENHEGTEARCLAAYKNAVAFGKRLQEAVLKRTGQEMLLAFVTAEQGEQLGFTTTTFSFNLPPPEGSDAATRAALAQRFVDLLCRYGEFKPCVSFGQDNGLVYATVPATSTQGAIKEEDKAKQAVGGVQLVRLSFPPTVDLQKLFDIIDESVDILYQK